jgi:nucleoside-diphosphate kinase
MEQTLVILKPDCVQRGLVGEVITRIERKGFTIAAMKLSMISKEKAEQHYQEHKSKPFFGELVSFITASPVVLMVVQGDQAVTMIRKMAGATKAEDAEPGTIRGDYVIHTGMNIIHTSDGIESARQEITRFFQSNELISYDSALKAWI